MRLIALLCIAALAGCAQVDLDDLPSASAVYMASRDRCFADTQGDIMECLIEAKRSLVVAIKLKKMDIFDAYATRMRLLAGQARKGGMTTEQFTAQYNAIDNDLTKAILAMYDQDQARQARIAAGLAAMGEGMRRSAAAAQANRPINCTTNTIGSYTYTNCN